jgi:hypothetical protein
MLFFSYGCPQTLTHLARRAKTDLAQERFDMTAKVFAKTTGNGLDFLSTTFDATESDDVRPGFEDATKYAHEGWLPVVRVERPETDPGYMTVFAGWVLTDEAVSESWDVVQRPQPYPSWSWVQGEGWQAPVPMPEGDGWQWDESAGEWVDVTP